MADMQSAFEKAGFKSQNPGGRPAKRQHRSGSNKGNDEAKSRENLKKAFGSDYTRLILSFKKDEYNDLVTKTKLYVEKNAKNITTSQLRNIFNKILQAKEPFDAYQLRPKLAYVAGRTQTQNWQMKELILLLDDLICTIENKEQLKNFKDFFESIIAYHRYFNPKGN